jgi:hypothetical protein
MKKIIFGLISIFTTISLSIGLSSTYAYEVTTGVEFASLNLSKDYFVAGKDVVINNPVL